MRLIPTSLFRYITVTTLAASAPCGALAQQSGVAPTVPDMPQIKGTFVALSVPDLQASIAWYVRTFDLRQVFTIPAMGPIQGGALLEGPGLSVELLQHRDAKPGSTPAELTHGFAKVGLLVDDFDGLVAALRARGATFNQGPSAAKPGQRPSVMMKDNAGNVLQFLGPLAPR